MRAAVGGFFHETNTFCAIRTDLDSFKARDYMILMMLRSLRSISTTLVR